MFTKDELLKEYNAYQYIKNTFNLNEEFNIEKVSKDLENKNIYCSSEEVRDIIEKAKEFAWNSDKIHIKNVEDGKYVLKEHKFNL